MSKASEALVLKAEQALEKPSKAILPLALEKAKQLQPEQAVDLAVNGGLAYLGYKAFGNLEGSLFGPIALKIAQGESEAAGIAGVIGLATLGVAQAYPKEVQFVVEAISRGVEGAGFFPPKKPGEFFRTLPVELPALLAGERVFIEHEWRDKSDIQPPTVDKAGFFACPEGWRLVRGLSGAICVKEISSGSETGPSGAFCVMPDGTETPIHSHSAAVACTNAGGRIVTR